VRILGEAAGLHLVAEFPGVDFNPELVENIEAAGVSVIPVEELALIKGFHTGQIIIGYAHLSQDEMITGLARLKLVIYP
jgi:GntR family transcriptional regulator/MocR family aminotransferase